jgi:ATP-dependent Clp protease ATP-binding subunit ClpA
MSEARDLNHSYVGTEHLLLGLLREEKGIAAQVLVDAGLTLDVARSAVLTILGTNPNSAAGEGIQPASERINWLGSVPAEQYPKRVRAVLNEARALVIGPGTTHTEPIHVAVALLRHSAGVANVALERLGCDRAALLSALDAQVANEPRNAEHEATVQRSRSLQAALVAAYQERHDRGASTLDTHHLLIGLFRADDRIAAVFAAQNITVDRLRDEAERVVG